MKSPVMCPTDVKVSVCVVPYYEYISKALIYGPC